MTPRIKICSLLTMSLIMMSFLFCACSPPHNSAAAEECKTFSSYQELKEYVQLNTGLAKQFSMVTGNITKVKEDMVFTETVTDQSANRNTQMKASAPAGNPTYSKTNVQVAGVDEADIVKTDGKFMYVLSDNRLVILQAYPAEESKILSEMEFQYKPNEMYLYKNRLVIVFQTNSGLKVNVLDISNREKPRVIKEMSLSGSYVTSRMIDNWAYLIVNEPVYGDDVNPPSIYTGGEAHEIQPSKIHYFEMILPHYSYTTIVAVNAITGAFNSETFLTDTSKNIFASQNHIYLTSAGALRYNLFSEQYLTQMEKTLNISIKDISDNNSLEKIDKLNKRLNDITPQQRQNIKELNRQWRDELMAHYDTTTIYKLKLNNGHIAYQATGQVEGHVLNQFSMDEYQNHFRIATTTDSNWINGNRCNNLYVLDNDLQITGKVENLAPGERIYSARFMGEKAYLVTFRQVDPLFVIDLKDPQKPRVLGELKIPGYSNYLHPIDENHLIGIGRQVALAGKREVSLNADIMVMPPPIREQGIKIALFDVTNPTNPKVLSEYVFEDNRSNSPALHDHKAVMFSNTEGKLVIPVSLQPEYHIMNEKYPYTHPKEWQGVYIFDVSVQNGIELAGGIPHPNPVKRSLYIENGLYSISTNLIKINDFNTLNLINKIAI